MGVMWGACFCAPNIFSILRQSKGNIVNMSSVNGYFVEPSCAGYCTTSSYYRIDKSDGYWSWEWRDKELIALSRLSMPDWLKDIFRVKADPVKARREAGEASCIMAYRKTRRSSQSCSFFSQWWCFIYDRASVAVDGALVPDCLPDNCLEMIYVNQSIYSILSFSKITLYNI